MEAQAMPKRFIIKLTKLDHVELTNYPETIFDELHNISANMMLLFPYFSEYAGY